MAETSRRAVLTAGTAALLGACAHGLKVPRDIAIRPGADQFEMDGGHGHAQHRIVVHYYRPRSFTTRSPILFVLPGAARNAFECRETWMPFATDAGALVLALGYPKAHYDVAAYDFGGVVQNLRLGPPQAGSSPDTLYLRDEDFRFEVNARRREWLFDDFERLFRIVKRLTDSSEDGYDMFGHGAGAQIVQRHALMSPASHARRMVAANADFYTLPDRDAPPLAGLQGLGFDTRALRLAFARKLTVLLGEKAGAEPDGLHLRTPTLDRQGGDALARGRHFHEFSAAQARALRADFRWQLAVAPHLGNDVLALSRVAAKLLYA